MTSIHQLPTPALLLDLDVLDANLRRMAGRAASLGAATVLATVVSHRPGESTSVVDAGALALSKEAWSGPEGRETMGEVFADYEAGLLSDGARLVKLSQEHGVVSAALPVGSRVRILPNHSCLAVAQFDEVHAVRGEEVVDRWKIWRGR